jgi:hypothetical protein
MPMPQQLTPIAIFRTGYPHPRKAILQQQLPQQLGIQAVRILLAHPLGLDPRPISDPQLEAQFRQLQNVIERSMILCEGDELSVDESWLSPAVVVSTNGKRPLTKQLESQEKEMIEVALAES